MLKSHSFLAMPFPSFGNSPIPQNVPAFQWQTPFLRCFKWGVSLKVVITLQEINISHLWKRKIIFKYALSGGYVSSLEGNSQCSPKKNYWFCFLLHSSCEQNQTQPKKWLNSRCPKKKKKTWDSHPPAFPTKNKEPQEPQRWALKELRQRLKSRTLKAETP